MTPEELKTHTGHIKDWEEHKVSPWVLILVAVLLSVPFGLCCYLLLR
jgi:hypothetical protein